MKAWVSISLSVGLMCAACGGDDGAGGSGGTSGAGGAAGMASGGAAGTSSGGTGGGGTGGMGGSGGSNVGGASGMSMAGSGGMGGGGGGGEPSGDGQVVAPWDAFCVATFTEDFDAVDSFGDVALSVHAGERYLLGEMTSFVDAMLIYITADGPVEIEMELDDPSMPPFTSSCTGAAITYSAVFVETVVYSDEALTMPACTLAAGVSVPGSGVSYALVGDLFTSLTYQVTLGDLAAECDGVTEGYVMASNITVGTTTYGALPFATVLGPVM